VGSIPARCIGADDATGAPDGGGGGGDDDDGYVGPVQPSPPPLQPLHDTAGGAACRGVFSGGQLY
jgi:hypothetical protein